MTNTISVEPNCPMCGDSGHLGTDPGPYQGCWETDVFCACPRGRREELRQESNSWDDEQMTDAHRAAWAMFTADYGDPDPFGMRQNCRETHAKYGLPDPNFADMTYPSDYACGGVR